MAQSAPAAGSVPGITAQDVGDCRFWQSTVPAAKQQIDDALQRFAIRCLRSISAPARQRVNLVAAVWGEQREPDPAVDNLAHVLHQTSHASEITAPLSLLVDSFGLLLAKVPEHGGSVAHRIRKETLLHPLNNGEMLNAINLPVDVL